MGVFMDMARFFALDLVADTKVACTVSNFSYYFRINVCVFGPLVVSGGVVLACIVWNSCTNADAVHHMSAFYSQNVVVRGLWYSVHPLFFILDLLHPIVTRTLLQPVHGIFAERPCIFTA